MSVFQSDKTYGLLAQPENEKTRSEIEQAGAHCILFPAVEIREETGQQTKIFQSLENYDWLIFADIFAVEYFLATLENSGIDFYELDNLRVCTFGETVADALRFAQIHSDVISNLAQTSSVWQDLGDYEPNVEGLRFLIPKLSNNNMEIIDKLRFSGAVVTEFPVYQSKIDDEKIVSRVLALLKGGAIDEFIFRSPADVVKTSILFDGAENLSDIFADTTVSATNQQTAKVLREYGFARVSFR